MTRDAVEVAYVASGSWVDDEWRHVTWASVKTTATDAAWDIYINGVRSGSKTGKWPTVAAMATSYIGKSTAEADSQYVGFLDSLLVFPAALEATHALGLAQVSACILSACQSICVMCTLIFLCSYFTSVLRSARVSVCIHLVYVVHVCLFV